ncbi:anti-sigma factor [Phenylobacterium sp.]|jgi:anti-sigma-K factor RskA|uniref:anti-sigma factor n=1 Tax=Phenylobacterium sp. TaxID=1871053 RepID=UPI002F94AF01
MSEPHELSELEALAAEHALGVLSARERAEAEARMASDPAFAAMVEAWRGRMTPLLDAAPEVEPPAELWPRIERRLPANDDVRAVGRLRFWRGAAIGSLGLLAASLAAVVFLASQVTGLQTPVQPAPILNASLTPGAAGAQPLFVAAFDPQRQALIVTSLVPPGADPLHVHQLWLIPQDGKPRSLGFVEPGASRALPMPQTIAQLAAAGTSLAVSVEPPGGSTNPEGPSGPIAASGKLTPI